MRTRSFTLKSSFQDDKEALGSVDRNAFLGNQLPLGTTHVWKEDGSVNPDRLKTLIYHVADEKQTRVTKSKLDAYLAKCAAEDPEEKETGRNTASVFSSKSVQVLAVTSAWGEVYLID